MRNRHRLTSVDPLAEKYYSISPYAYCLNNPINLVDPDGKKVIFINGYLGFGSPHGGASYWGGQNGNFVNGAQLFFKDNATYFTNVEHNFFSSASGRQKNGYEYAKENYNSLIQGMKNGETFKFVSHSMGGAFSTGIEQYLAENGWKVESSIFINTYQSDKIKTNKDDSTFKIDYQNTNDPVLFWFDTNLGNGQIKNANLTIREKSDAPISNIHRDPIDSGKDFWKNLINYINTLQKGKP